MNRDKIINLFKSLARSQGFYGRLLRNISDAEDRGEDLTGFFAQFADCKDDVDVIMKIEC